VRRGTWALVWRVLLVSLFPSLWLAWLEVFLQTVALMHLCGERHELRFLAPPTISALDKELKMFSDQET